MSAALLPFPLCHPCVLLIYRRIPLLPLLSIYSHARSPPYCFKYVFLVSIPFPSFCCSLNLLLLSSSLSHTLSVCCSLYVRLSPTAPTHPSTGNLLFLPGYPHRCVCVCVRVVCVGVRAHDIVTGVRPLGPCTLGSEAGLQD